MNLIHQIPLFPLGLFLLEGEQTQLHIFEERYKQLIQHCENLGTGFGIVFANPLNTQNIGSYVSIKEVIKRYDTGEMDIIVECKSLFKVKKFYQKGDHVLYPKGDVSMHKILNFSASFTLLQHFFEYIESYNKVVLNFQQEHEIQVKRLVEELPLDDLDKLEISKLENKEDIEKFLINYIKYLNILEYQEKQTFQNFYLN